MRQRASRGQSGLSLIELMVALALGALVSIGILSLFGATAKTGRVQNGLARLQESGRYLVSRMNADLRAGGGQFCSNGGAVMNASRDRAGTHSKLPDWREPRLYVSNFRFPDWNGAPISGTDPIDLSSRFFIQGYDCSASGCTPLAPALPADLPATGLTAGARVPGSDVLTVRYQRGSGWPVSACAADGSLGVGTNIEVAPAPALANAPADPAPNFETGDLALISDCSHPQVFRIGGIGGTPAKPLLQADAFASNNGIKCPGFLASTEVRAFNFSKDFVTVSYYLRLRADTNPDRPGRLIPVLVRREATSRSDGSAVVDEQELAQGVERLDFLYGIQGTNDSVRFLTAAEVHSGTVCPAVPNGADQEAACGWRQVRSIELHLLLNSVDDQFDLTDVDTAYRYSIDAQTIAPAPAATADMPVTQLKAGRMMRREFVSLVSTRNYNP